MGCFNGFGLIHVLFTVDLFLETGPVFRRRDKKPLPKASFS